MARREKNPDILNLFEDTKIEIGILLKDHKAFHLEGGVLYFVSKEEMERARELRNRLDDALETNSDKKRFGFNLISRLLNPDQPAQNYFTGVKGKHRQINDAEKVKVNIEKEFAIWKNIVHREMHEYVALHEIEGEGLLRLEIELQKRIKEGEARFEYIVENFDALEVRIAGWKHEKLYPYVSFSIEGKLVHKHLSIEVPSLLWLELAKYRSDMSVADFIRQSTNAFGDVYYMVK